MEGETRENHNGKTRSGRKKVVRGWCCCKPLGRLSAGIARILMASTNPSGHLAWIVAISLLWSMQRR